MSQKYVEKAFLYLLALSVLLHLTVFLVVYFLPKGSPPVKQEPYMVELADMPSLKASPPPSGAEQKKARRHAEERRRVARETAPKGTRERDKLAAPTPPVRRPSIIAPGTQGGPVTPPPSSQPAGKGGTGRGTAEETAKDGSILKPRGAAGPSLPNLFPTAERLARLEESYRKKYSAEVAEGEAKFLNTDDIVFGSFLRRFESAVYGVWKYPEQAARMGIEGVTAVRITFNRKGVVERVEVLEASGSRILDDEVLRTLHTIGPIGNFPRKYDQDEFNLIAFFHYGIIHGVSRSLH